MWLRLRQIALVARQLEPVLADVQAVFGLEVAYRDPGVAQFGLENAVLPVGAQFLEIVAPVQEGTAGGRYLDRRQGDGGYMVILQCDEHPPRRARVEELGIRTVTDHDDGRYVIMQLHPRDTGGSFLEIDEQRGGDDLSGPWMPAGPDWQQAVRTDTVQGIAAAEIQAPDPSGLAQRWSDILEVPVGVDGEGRTALALDNATLRFVPDTDGRGEGLGGVDVLTVDGDRVRAAADERGLTIDGDMVVVGGVRFGLVDVSA
jgi:Glyoxalase-like domain